MSMMNREQAEVYSKKIGCKFFVRNSNGGLYGGFTSREDAEECLAEAVQDWEDSPWNNGENIRFYIEEAVSYDK